MLTVSMFAIGFAGALSAILQKHRYVKMGVNYTLVINFEEGGAVIWIIFGGLLLGISLILR